MTWVNLVIGFHAQNSCENELMDHGPLTVLGDGIWRTVKAVRVFHRHLKAENPICTIREIKEDILSNQNCFPNFGSVHCPSSLLYIPQ